MNFLTPECLAPYVEPYVKFPGFGWSFTDRELRPRKQQGSNALPLLLVLPAVDFIFRLFITACRKQSIRRDCGSKEAALLNMQELVVVKPGAGCCTTVQLQEGEERDTEIN